MRILIIRHGEPDYSIDSLTPKGWREAEMLSKRLAQLPIDDFYVSPMGRAKDTARATLDKVGKKAEVLDWMMEFHGRATDPFSGDKRIPWDLVPGYWTRQPELYDREAWRDHAIYRGTDVVKVYDATAAGLDALLARYGYVRDGGMYRCEENRDVTIALFCHFALGMTMLSYLTGISPVLMWQNFFMPTSSVTTLMTEERVKGEMIFKCVQVGDTSHLYAEGEPLSRAGLFQEIHGKMDGSGAR